MGEIEGLGNLKDREFEDCKIAGIRKWRQPLLSVH
jgi:hypothetical protein